EKRRTDCDGTVGNVEGRKRPAATVDLQKICDSTARHPIIEITGGTPQNERQAEPGRNGSESVRTLPKRHDYEEQHDYRNTDEDDTAQHGVAVSEYSKGRARVLSVDNAKPAMDHVDGVVGREVRANPDLAQPVEYNDGRGHEEGHPTRRQGSPVMRVLWLVDLLHVLALPGDNQAVGFPVV